MRVKKEQKVTTIMKYIAYDGKVFYDIHQCESYEKEKKFKKERMEKLSKYMVDHWAEQIPIHCNAEFSELMHYTWFKMNNNNERKELETLLENPIQSPLHYPLYICCETEYEFDGEPPEYIYTSEECMGITKSFFNGLGFDVKFERR